MNGNLQLQLHDQKREARAAGQRRGAQKAGRDGGQFLALPVEVVRSDGWLRASHTARSLLLAMATAPTKSGGMPMNGRLSASMSVLEKLGWRSEGTVRSAVKALLACGLIHQTRLSSFPNVCGLYAVTWLKLGPTDGLDASMVNAFARGAYERPEKPAEPTQRRRTAAATEALRAKVVAQRLGYTAAPSDGGPQPAQAAVSRRLVRVKPPLHGAIDGPSTASSPPLDGANLDIAISRQRGTRAALSRMGRSMARAKPQVVPAAYDLARRTIKSHAAARSGDYE